MAGWCPDPARAIAANAVLYSLGVVLYQFPKGVGIATSIRVGNILGRPAASVLAGDGTCALVRSDVEAAVRDAKLNMWVGTGFSAILGVSFVVAAAAAAAAAAVVVVVVVVVVVAAAVVLVHSCIHLIPPPPLHFVSHITSN